MDKKIIFINSLSNGGAERVVSILWNKISSNESYELALIEDDVNYDISLDDYFVINSNKKRRGFLFILLDFFSLLRSERPRVVQSHLNQPNFLNCFAKFFFKNHQAQIVHCVAYGSSSSSSGVKGRLKKLISEYLFRLADHHVFKSHDMYLDYLEFFRHQPRSYEVINNPYDFKKINEMSLEDLDADFSSSVNIVCVGRLVSEKDQKTILLALSLLDIDVHLHVLGDGVCRPDLKDMAVGLGLKNKVTFYGNVKNPFPYYAASDYYVSASQAEGFPNTLVESMALGCYPIHSDCVSGPRELLSHPIVDKDGFQICEFGVLFPVGNYRGLASALQHLINQCAHKSEEKINHIKESVTRYDVDVIVGKYERCLNRVR